MKKTTIMVAFCCLAFLSNAQNSSSTVSSVEMTTSREFSQELITTSNGIEVYFSSSDDQSGNTLLNIRFVNTTKEAVSFVWEVSKERQVFKSQNSISIKSGESFDQSAAFEIKGTTDLSDYSITLTSN